MHNALVAASALLLAHCGASPIAALKARQSCPDVHVFGARETTAPEGFGTAGVVVDLVLGAYSGATSEAIDYPACGGQSSCGGDDYSTSMTKGIQAVASAVNSFHEQCPDTQLVLVGYSQGGQIIDNAFCGGPDDSNGYTDSSPAIDSSALSAIAAVIEMGSPRFVSSLDYGVGTCSAGGFSARPSGYTCSSSAKMQSYCDAADPYCCDGNDESTHQGYGDVYGQDALTFIQGQLDGASSGPTSSDSTQQEGGANGTSSSTEDLSSSGGTASVPTAGDGQSSSGSQDSGAQAGNQGANQWNQNNGAQGGNQWGQAGQGQGQWGGWGKKN